MLQLVARYCAWVRASLERRDEQPAATAPPAGGEAAAADEGSGEVGAGGGEGGSCPPRGWAAGAGPERFASLWRDVDLLARQLRTALLPALLSRLSGLPEEAHEAAAAGVEAAGAALAGAGEALLAAAAERLVKACCLVLKQLRGIVATFRMTNRAQVGGAACRSDGAFPKPYTPGWVVGSRG